MSERDQYIALGLMPPCPDCKHNQWVHLKTVAPDSYYCQRHGWLPRLRERGPSGLTSRLRDLEPNGRGGRPVRMTPEETRLYRAGEMEPLRALRATAQDRANRTGEDVSILTSSGQEIEWCTPLGAAFERNGRATVADPTAARELSLYIENEYSLIGAPNSIGKSIDANLRRKLTADSYDSSLAPKAWQHLIDAGAKKYEKEFGDGSPVFNAATRRSVAVDFAQAWEQENGANGLRRNTGESSAKLHEQGSDVCSRCGNKWCDGTDCNVHALRDAATAGGKTYRTGRYDNHWEKMRRNPEDEPLTLESIERQIREAYLDETGGLLKERVLLKDLRPRVGVQSDDFDQTLLSMQRQGKVVLMGLDNPMERTSEVEAAAVYIAGRPRHLVYFQGPTTTRTSR